MFQSWRLGTAFGIGIFVHWSFILLPLFVLWSDRDEGPAHALHVLLLIAGVFGCVVLHELGHALTARRFGIGTRDITLTPLGGIASLERMSDKPWEEFWITVMGPAVNVVIAAVLGVVLLFTTTLVPLAHRPWSLGEIFLAQMLWINGFMVLFNMIPAFPMDGGRVFRAVLSMRLGRLRATEIAATSGVFFAGLIILAGLGVFGGLWGFPTGMHPFMIMIGLFVLMLGQGELFAVRQQERERDLKQRGLWPTAPNENYPGSAQPPIIMEPQPAVPVDLVPPAEPNFSGFTWDAGRRAWIEWRNGQAVHICWVK